MRRAWRFLCALTIADLFRILTCRRPRKGAAAPPAPLQGAGPGTPVGNLRCARRTIEALVLAYPHTAAGTGMSHAELAEAARHVAGDMAAFAAQMEVDPDAVQVDVPDYPDDLLGGTP